MCYWTMLFFQFEGTLLHEAVGFGCGPKTEDRLKIVQVLLKHKADPNAKDKVSLKPLYNSNFHEYAMIFFFIPNFLKFSQDDD